MQSTEDEKLKFLYAALKEAQDNVRNYDTKAQIVSIGYLFTIGAISKVQTQSLFNAPLDIIMMWAIIIFPLILFAAVLYPTRKMAPSVKRGRKAVKALFYFHPSEVVSVDEYVNQLDEVDIEQELSYELFKVSVLRDLKRVRFLRALFFASLGLIFLFVKQISPYLINLS